MCKAGSCECEQRLLVASGLPTHKVQESGWSCWHQQNDRGQKCSVTWGKGQGILLCSRVLREGVEEDLAVPLVPGRLIWGPRYR